LGKFISPKFATIFALKLLHWEQKTEVFKSKSVYTGKKKNRVRIPPPAREYVGFFKVCLHKPCFSVSDATAASDNAQKIGLFLSLDAAVASDTEKHCPCK
jgi:hypothetical protein